MPDSILPVSVARKDPWWFHNNATKTTVFTDKRGIVNGIRCDDLRFPGGVYSALRMDGEDCSQDCPFKGMECPYRREYRAYLGYSLDFERLMESFRKLCQEYGKEDIALLVYENPKSPCGERPVLKELFQQHGVELEEWVPGKF